MKKGDIYKIISLIIVGIVLAVCLASENYFLTTIALIVFITILGVYLIDERWINMDYRDITKLSLQRELNKILNYYMVIYDEYYSTRSRDSAFLKDLVDSLIGISAVLEVYVEHKGIHPNYALEKLNFSKSFIDACIRYYEGKRNDN